MIRQRCQRLLWTNLRIVQWTQPSKTLNMFLLCHLRGLQGVALIGNHPSMKRPSPPPSLTHLIYSLSPHLSKCPRHLTTLLFNALPPVPAKHPPPLLLPFQFE